MLSAKQGGIRYHLSSLWYNSTWDWIPVSRTIGEHSKHYAKKEPVGWYPRGVLFEAIGYGIVVSEFELLSRYYVHFWTNTLGNAMNPFILPAIGQIDPPLLSYLDYRIVVNEFELQSRFYTHFRTNTLGEKVWILLSSLLLVKYNHHYCPTWRMNLALNNPSRLIYHWNKEIKLKETFIFFLYCKSLFLVLTSLESETRVQILNEAVCVSLCANAHKKDMNPSLPSYTMGKFQGKMDSLTLIR